MIYEYKCVSCEQVTEAVRSIDRRNEAPACDACGGDTKKIISSYRVHGDFAPYYDDNLETYVQSKQHRKKVMKEKSVSEIYGKGWSSW